MLKTKYKIYTLGCKVNQYDSASLAARLFDLGLEEVRTGADWVIVNTCAVTKTAIRKGRQLITKARKENPGAEIILAGCWPKAYSEAQKDASADFVFGTNESEKIIELLKSKIGAENLQKIQPQSSTIASTDRSRYFVKIQDGCEQFCAYCIIPYTRGKLKSRDEAEIISEIEEAVKAGYQEIILSGIHLGLFGKDKGEVRLVPLIKKILAIKNFGRLRLSSIEVTEVSDDLIDLIASDDKMCKHLHIPLQAGTDKILRAMNRPYDTKYFWGKIQKIRNKIPDIAITNDIIVGFPSETAEDFADTCKFIKQVNFSKLHIFSFSAHEKTPAAKMPEQVDPREVKRRSDELHRIDEELQADYFKKFKNQELWVVLDGRSGEVMRGKSEYFFDVEFKPSQLLTPINKAKKLAGQIVKIKLK